MLLSKGSVKLRSLGLPPLVLALAGLVASATTGCFFIGHDDDDYREDRDETDEDVGPGDDVDNPDTGAPPETQEPGKDPETGITMVDIQPDQLLEAKPGEGVGIFVEVTAAGQWHVWTTCDTFTSKAVCSFDIFASTPNAEHLVTYAADQVEGFDTVKDLGGGTLEFVVDTDSDTDGLLLDMEIGAPLVLEVYLDGQGAEGFVYWVSDDILHAGAPDNPIQFVPVLTAGQ